MKSEYRRIVTQASEEQLASWILKNLDWGGGNSDENGAFLASILLEHRRQCARPEAEAIETLRFVREVIRHSPIEHQVVDLDTMTGLGAWLDARLPSPERTK